MSRELKPLPQPVIAAARLREMAKALLLEAEELEAAAGYKNYTGTRRGEFKYATKAKEQR